MFLYTDSEINLWRARSFVGQTWQTLNHLLTKCSPLESSKTVYYHLMEKHARNHKRHKRHPKTNSNTQVLIWHMLDDTKAIWEVE